MAVAQCNVCGNQIRYETVEDLTSNGWNRLETREETMYYCPRHSKPETIVQNAFTR